MCFVADADEFTCTNTKKQNICASHAKYYTGFESEQRTQPELLDNKAVEVAQPIDVCDTLFTTTQYTRCFCFSDSV